MEIELRLVRYAVTLADHLHFGRAALKLRIAQQTLSSQIVQLESRLGVELFVRDRRQVALTPAGRLFVDRGRRLLAEARDMVTEVSGTGALLRIDVITEGLHTTDVIARRLRSLLPDVTLQITQKHGFPVAAAGVVQGGLDLAFGQAHGLGGTLPNVLRHQVVRLEPMGVTLPRGHVLAGYGAVRMTELAQWPLLLHTAEEAADWREWNEELAAEFGLRIARRLHGHGRSATHAAVLSHQEPALGPLQGPVPPGVVVRPVVEPVPVYPMAAVWHSARSTGPLDRAVAAIRDIATDHGWLEQPPRPWWMPGADRCTCWATPPASIQGRRARPPVPAARSTAT